MGVHRTLEEALSVLAATIGGARPQVALSLVDGFRVPGLCMKTVVLFCHQNCRPDWKPLPTMPTLTLPEKWSRNP